MKKWKKGGRDAEVIDLTALRGDETSATPASETVERRTPAVDNRDTERRIKVMLFADVKNFSKLSEEQSPAFFKLFLGVVADVLNESPRPPAFQNTWGDGLFVVFDDVIACAESAWRLLKRMKKIDWELHGLPAGMAVRLGMHAGPVFSLPDPIIGRKNVFGSHVNLAARIEPVTLPGCAFCSEQFAALLAVEPDHDFVCEYVGIEKLAKEYDKCALYRLARR